MPGIRIDVDVSRGLSNLTDFRKALTDTGVAAKLSDRELGVLADRFRDKLQADRAEAALGTLRRQIEQVGQAAGLSTSEINRLQSRMGLMSNSTGNAGNALSNMASSASSAGTSLGGLAAKVGVAVAAYISLREVVSFVSDSIQNAARYETLGVVLGEVGKNAGYTRDEMLGLAEGIQKAGISMIASREALAKMATAQLDLSKSTELARVAQNAAVISGKNSSEAFERIVQGIANGQTVLIRHQGILVDLEDAYKKYAAQLGVSKDDLTETQKRQAAMNAVLEAGARSAGAYEAAMMTAGKQITSFQRYLDDVKTTLGQAFLDSFTSNVFNAADAMKQFQSALQEPEVQAAISSLANAISSMINWVISNVPAAIQVFSKFLSVVGSAIGMIQNYRDSLPELFGVFGDAAVGVINLFNSTGPEKVAKMTSAIEAAKKEFNSMDEGAEKLKLGETIQRQTDALEKFKNSAKNAHSLSNRITPTDEEKKAVDDYWAKWNKGVKEYETNTSGALAIGKNPKNDKHLPIDQQYTQAFTDYERQIKNIGVAWKEAYNKGQWEDVLALNKSASVAVGEYNDKLDQLDRKANRGAKAAENAAIAAERYGAQASAYLDSVVESLQSMEDTLTGSGNKEADRIDKWFTQALNQAQKAMIGAKGETAAYQQAIDLLTSSYQRLHDLAVQKDMISSLKQQAEIWQQLAQVLDTPAINQKASDSSNAAWTAELSQKINGQASGEAKRVWDDAIKAANMAGADMNAIWQGVADKWTAIDKDKNEKTAALEQASNEKRLQGQADAYKDYSAVSSKYWEAEKALLESKLAKVKANADDELAYKIYAAQQWDAYNKKALERQAQYAGSFGETFSAQWSLAFGSYKSDITKARDEWTEFSDSVIDLAKGMGDAVAGSWGDAIRNIASGKTDISSIGKNMVSRMIDSVAGFMEKSMKQSWNSMLRDLFGSDLSEAMGGTSSSALTSQTATLTASTASMDISTATINVASGSMNGGGGATGNATLNGSSGSDSLSFSKTLGQSAGDSFADSFQNNIYKSSDGLLFANTQGIETLIGSSSPIWQRQNNPGNLTTRSGSFATYDSMEVGLKSMVDYLKRRIDQGYNTIEKMKDIYAEGSEVWASNVSKGSGLDRGSVLVSGDSDLIQKLSRGVAVAEGSSKSIPDELLYKLTHGGSTLSNSDIKSLGSAIGSASGKKFYDTLQVEQQTSNSPQQDTLFSVQGTESLKSAEDALSSSGIKWNKIGGVLSGLSQVAVGAASGNVGSMIGGGLSTIGGIGGMIGGTVGSMLGSYLPIVGTIVSVVSTLLSSSTKTEKTGSGYNVAINAGHVALAGVDFYRTTTTSGYSTSTSHTAQGTGIGDPDVGRQITKYLKDTAKNLKEFGKELGISTEALKEFSVPMATLTDNMISKYERNISNLMAQTVLGEQGLQGAFDYVAQDYEVYVDEFERLGEAYKTVGGYTSAYGYDLSTMANITDSAIAAIRQYNEESYTTASETLPMMLAMLGQTADVISSVTDTLTENAATAATVTDEQYRKILEADYASQLEDAVGGEDAFKTIMENLIKNVLNSLESYQAQAEYYTKKANESISEIGVSGVTIDNFWGSFSNAMKSAMTVDQFELWSDASTWVNNLNTMNDAIEAWNENIKKVTATLTARDQSATGQSRQAEITSLLSTQEQELYEARKNNYDQDTFNYILEVQRLELSKKYADLDQDEYQKQQDLYARMATASDLSEQSTLISKYAAAEKELYEARAEGYSEATMALLEATQSAELAKTLSDNLKDVQNKIQSFQSKWADLTSREYAANKNDVMSGYTALQSQQAAEILQAYQDGMSQEYINKLKEVQSDELAKKWKDLNLSKLQDDLSDVKDDLDKIVNKFQEAMDSITTLIDAELSNVKSLAASADSANSSIASTLKDLTSGSDSPLNASQKAASLYYQIATAYGTMISTNASTASTSGGLDTTGLSGSQTASSLGGLFSTASSTMYSASGAAKTAAAQTISDLAGDYLSALKSSLGDSAAFYDKYIDVLTALKQAQSITGSEKSYETTIADALTAEQTILSDILKEIQKGSDASTTKIQALLQSSQAISSSMSGLYDDTVNNQTSWRTTVTNLLQQAGYSSDDITAALGGPTSTSSFLARLNAFNQTTMPSYIQSILDLLTKLINIQGQITTQTPTVTQPTTGSSYTQDEINWANNVRSAMNYENYGGSSSWTVDQVLTNLATYAAWANAYGVSSTTAFTVPTGGASNYYYQEAAAYNKQNKTTKTYLDMQNAVASQFGGNANYLAHWLGYGWNEGISFPTDDYVMSQTAKYFLSKWQRDGGAASGYSNPLAEATYIEQSMMGTTSWTTSALEAAAKAHYDAYGKSEGLIKPYALGGFVDSPLALVGEIGPEIIASPGATVTPAAVTQNLFGDAFSALTKEVRELRAQLYAVMRSVAYNSQQTYKIIDKWDTEGTPAVAS